MPQVPGESIGTARIDIIADTAAFEAQVARAKSQIATLGPAGEASFAKMTAAQKRATLSALQFEQSIGKSRDEMRLLSLAARGAAPEALERLRQKMLEVRAASAGSALDSARFSDAQLLSANRALAAFKTQSEAAKSAAAAQAEIAAADDARFRQIAANATAEVEARQAITAATMEQARASAALAESQGASSGTGAARAVGVLDAATVRQQIADYAALDAIMGKKVATTEEVAAAEAALDRLQKAGMLSNEQLAESFSALDTVTAAETKALQANSVAQAENAVATRANSKAQYELGILAGEAASGNINRLKRSGAALVNALGLLRTTGGVAFLGITAGITAAVAAAYKGEEEFSNFNRMLIATGNYAGITYTQYRNLAQSFVDGNTSIGKAKDALNALLQTGKFSGDALRKAAQAALDMSALTGQSVEQAVASISKLADDPVKAIEARDRQYHFLSTTTLQRIQQLEDLGNKQDAATLAEDTYAEALRSRASQMESNLLALQKVWESLGSSASFAWDKMEGLGRPQTALGAMSDSYDKLLEFRQSVADRLAGKGTLMDFFNSPDAIGGKSTAGMSLQQQLTAIDALLAKMRGDMKPLQDASNAAAMAKADAAGLQQAGNEGVQTLAKLGINLDGIKNKQDKVREAATALFNIYRAGGKLPKGVSFTGPIADVPVGPGWEAIKKQLMKGSPEAEAAKRAAEALASFQQYAQGRGPGSLAVPGDTALTKYVQDTAALVNQFDKAIKKGADAGAATKAYWQAAADNEAKYENAVAKQRAKDAAAVKAYQHSLDDMLKTRQAQIDLQVQSVGMGQLEVQQRQQLIAIDEDYNRKADSLRRQQQNSTSAIDKAAYQQQLDDLKAYHDKRIQMEITGFAAEQAARGNWVNGARAALADFSDQAADVAGQTRDVFMTAFGDLTDALTNFVMTGKISFKSLVDDVLKGIVQMEMRAAEAKIFQLIAGMFSGVSDNGSAAYASYDTSGGAAIGAGYVGQAMGGVWSGPSIAALSGSVLTRPTYIPMARGGVLAGEAGDEAIMPLSRGPNGKLGVKATGGQQIELHINLKNESGQALQAKQQGQASMDGNKIMADFVLTTVATDVVKGGSTAKAMQQRFGLARAGVPVGA